MVNLQRDRWSDENQDALESLIWAIESYSSDGKFAIVFVRCNARELWRNVLAHLRQDPELDLCQVSLSPSATTLYGTIASALDRRKTKHQGFPHAAIVSGLPEVKDLDALLNNAKKIIEELAKTFPFPLVLQATDEVVQRLIHIAPDIYSRASIEEFHQSIEEVNAFIDRTADEIFDRILEAGAGRFLDNVDLNLSRDSQLFWELDAARQALAESPHPIDPEREANLEFLLGNAADLDESKPQHYERSIAALQRALQELSQISELSQQQNENSGEDLNLTRKHRRLVEKLGCVFYCLGTSWRTRTESPLAPLAKGSWGDNNSAAEAAYLNFKQCIDLFEREAQFDLVAKFINALGDVLEHQQRWDELQAVGISATVLHRSHPNAFRLARAYNFLAEAALARGHWHDALKNAEQALWISCHATPDERITDASESQMFREWVRSFNQGAYYFSLARAQAGLGRHGESLVSFEKALTKTKPDYEPRLYARILEALRKVYFQQGDYLQAFRLKQQQYALEHQYGFRAFVGAGRLQPSKSVNPVDVEAGQQRETVARAIEASGRLEDVNRLVERIGRVDRKLTVLYGQSGVGKSSLLQAGLVPALSGRSIGSRDVVPVLLQVYADWESRLADALAATISKSFDETLSFAPTGVEVSQLSQQLREQTDRNRSIVLIFDQFEEFFITYSDREARQRFYQFFYDCLNLPYVKVVLALREDRLHQLLEIGRCVDLSVVNHNLLDKQILYYLGDFSIDSAKSVMVRLTQQSRLFFESELIDRVTNDLAESRTVTTDILSCPTGQSVRPIELQIVGAQLQTDRITTLAQYQQLGERPKETLVRRYLDDTLADCGPENQQIAQVLLYLLTDDNNTRPIKNRLDVEKELRSRCAMLGTANADELEIADDRLKRVLQIFVDSGLVFLFPETPIERYQLVHDYLVRYIRQQESAKLLEQLERLEAERRQQEIRLNRILKGAAIGAGLAALATTALAGIALKWAREARIERSQAQKDHVLAIESLNQYARELSSEQLDFEALLEGLRLARLSQQYDRHHETVSQPGKTLKSTDDRARFILQDALTWVREHNRLTRHDAPLVTANWHPDGTDILAADERGNLYVWTLSGAIVRRLVFGEKPLRQVEPSPASDLLATLDRIGGLAVWTLEGDLLARRPTDDATSLAWHPDSRGLAVGTSRGTVELWQVEGNSEDGVSLRQVAQWRDQESPVSQLSWSPDGTKIASTGGEATVKIWRVTAPFDRAGEAVFDAVPEAILDGQDAPIASLDWHPDGRRLATASLDGRIRVWDGDGESMRVWQSRGDRLMGVRWRPDGTMLAAGSWDATLELWKPGRTQPQERLRNETDGLVSLAWSPDGKRLATVHRLEGVKLWNFDDRPSNVVEGDGSAIARLSWHPDGEAFVTVSRQGTIALSNSDGETKSRWRGGGEPIADVVFSADGERILTAHSDGTAKLWQKSGRLLETLGGEGAALTRVAVSPDGKVLAAGSEDNTVRLWEKEGMVSIGSIRHEDKITAIAFHPTYPIVATASRDGTLRLSTFDGEEVSLLADGDREVTDMAWHSDGLLLAVAGRDRAIVLWKFAFDRSGTRLLEDAIALSRLWGHGAEITGLSWHPNGQILASSSRDRTVKLWSFANLETDSLQPMRTLSRESAIVQPLREDGFTDVSFSPDGGLLAASDNLGQVILWRNLDLDLETAIDRGCTWVSDYLHHNPKAPPDVRALCEGDGAIGVMR
ncbi:hypothetical protein [Baaleninema sp.]|uniref:WD40 domain-containing protein n=1 Tax=Baaleninema sp. TaxID=3101197 RepID=UPI003D048A13